MEGQLTITLNHEGLNDVVADHLEVGVADPMTDRGLRTGEKVVQDGNFMAKEHETVDEVGADKAGATGDKDALALRWREEPHRREAGEGGVGDGLGVRMENRLGLVRAIGTCELSMLSLLRLLALVALSCGDHVMRAEVEGTEDIEGDLAIKAKTLEADASYDVAALVQRTDLEGVL